MSILLSIPWKGGMHHCFVPLIEWLSKFPSSGSLLLCPGSQPAALSFSAPSWQPCPNFTVFSIPFTSLLSSKVKIKATPTLRVGVRTSHRWHIAFLVILQAKFSCFAKPFISGLSESLILCLLFFGGDVRLVLIQGFIFLISMLDLLYSANVSGGKAVDKYKASLLTIIRLTCKI